MREVLAPAPGRLPAHRDRRWALTSSTVLLNLTSELREASRRCSRPLAHQACGPGRIHAQRSYASVPATAGRGYSGTEASAARGGGEVEDHAILNRFLIFCSLSAVYAIRDFGPLTRGLGYSKLRQSPSASGALRRQRCCETSPLFGLGTGILRRCPGFSLLCDAEGVSLHRHCRRVGDFFPWEPPQNIASLVTSPNAAGITVASSK